VQLTDEETEEIFTVKDIVNYIDSF